MCPLDVLMSWKHRGHGASAQLAVLHSLWAGFCMACISPTAQVQHSHCRPCGTGQGRA
jgi:hypothetical protein